MANPNQEAINAAVSEIVVHLDKIAGNREQIKEILKGLKEKFDVNPKMVKKAATAIHKGKIAETREESAELADFIEDVVGGIEE